MSDRVAVLMTADASSNAARNAEVRRTPGRCIVQLGPVGLTVSWVRARVDTVAEGRLLVIEWLGAVARGVGLVPIQSIQSEGQRTARLLSEIVFRAAAVSEREWFWRDEANLHMRYRSEDLADHCAGSLRATLQRVEGR